MALNNDKLTEWVLGIAAVPVAFIINGVLQLGNRVSKLEGQRDDLVDRLDRIESRGERLEDKVDRILERHGGS